MDAVKFEENIDYKFLMETAVLAGEIMLSSGAETYRVEGTMNYILKMTKVKSIEALVIATGIIATLDDPKMDAITILRRVSVRRTNLNYINEVNNISRNLCEGKMTLQEAYDSLKHLPERQYPKWLVSVSTIFIAFGFTGLLGGKLTDCVMAGFASIPIILMHRIDQRIGLSPFIQDMLASILIALAALAGEQLFYGGMQTDYVIIGAIMPLVPGVAITNAIRDTLQGDYISGAAKILESFVIAASIAIGIGAGMAMFMMIGGII